MISIFTFNLGKIHFLKRRNYFTIIERKYPVLFSAKYFVDNSLSFCHFSFCLFVFDLLLIISPLVSSDCSYLYLVALTLHQGLWLRDQPIIPYTCTLFYGIHATQNEVIILKRITFFLKISTCFSAATHKGSASFHQAGSYRVVKLESKKYVSSCSLYI